MAINVYRLKVGDRSPIFEASLKKSGGGALDLTGATVRFVMKPSGGGATKVDQPAEIVAPATGGVVRYAQAAIDVDTPGFFDLEWQGIDAGGKPFTVPNDGADLVILTPRL